MIAKRRLLSVHRWVGLVLCFFILIQTATGALLVFRTHLAEALDPAGMTRASQSGEAPFSAVVGAALGRFPGYAIDHVVFPQTAEGVYLAQLLDASGRTRWVSVDPGTAQVLRAGTIWRFPLEAVLQIHYRLMTGRLGLLCVMATAVGLLTLALTGLAYWWPKPGRWRRSLAIESGAPPRLLLRRLHRNVGIFAAAAALFFGTTGLVVATEFILEPGPLMALAAPRQTAVGDLDGALAKARAIYAGRAIRDVRMPAPGVFKVFFWAPEMSPHAVHAVRLDPPAGRVLAVTPAQKAPGLWMSVLPIHSGDSFGDLGSAVVLIGALALFALAATGPLMWLQRSRGGSSPPRPTAKTR